MADLAILCRRHMTGILAHCLHTIMTSHAGSWRVMRVCRRQPALNFMAVAARIHALDTSRPVANRLTDRDYTIVARRAHTSRIVLVFGRIPTAKAMALVARVSRLGHRVMTSRLAGRSSAVVTSIAGARRYPDMIPACRSP